MADFAKVIAAVDRVNSTDGFDRYVRAQRSLATDALTGDRGRGWTDTMVRDLLGDADETRPNPRSRQAAPMRLYARSRVVEAEATDAFQQRRAAAAKRAEASRQSADRKREALLAEVEQLTVRVPQMIGEQLVRSACDSYNANAGARAALRGGDWSSASPNSDPEFLDRIMVNYLRHECTSYDSRLAALYRQVGKTEAADMIRERVYAAIAEVYPELWLECDRQMDRRAEP